jgi:actin-like ATPase involved in cell morphogenesis
LNTAIGLDIGSGLTKCFDGEARVIFPSIYAYRQPTIWEEKAEVIEGVGEKALEIARYPNAIQLYPIIDGKPQHTAFIKLAQEALHRLKLGFLDKRYMVSGLPYETGKQDRERLKETLRAYLGLVDIAIYPQGLGTLFDLELHSATAINIGHGTTEILVVEGLNILGGMSEPLASDYVLNSLSDQIQAKHGVKASHESLLELVAGKADEITGFGKSIQRKDIEDQLERNVEHLADKISYDARYMLTQLPSNLECANRIVLSGGGSLIGGIREAIRQRLGLEISSPSHPIFSNVIGFHKMAKKLYE